MASQDVTRRRLTITGQVQGVGFRPFVYRLAHSRLTGLVKNSPEGVVVEIQGPAAEVKGFSPRLQDELPPLARIVTLEEKGLAPVEGEKVFRIVKSEAGRGHRVLISPDTATCPDCVADMADPENRRHSYPFTNCTNCGPRYTITRSVPYDRPATSMACFPLCEDCMEEYGNPLDRRFHAQPNACPACGPRLWLRAEGVDLAENGAALRLTAQRLARGEVGALKGLGGFHLSCDACSEAAVVALRKRKRRPHKPLAVMVPDLDTAKALAHVSEPEAHWLAGSVRPIVLAQARRDSPLSPEVAPDTRYVGLMLPYTPLHHVLLDEYRRAAPDRVPALVMTSGNLSSEPICLGNREAVERLDSIADFHLFHDRDILIRTDDSVMRVNPADGDPILLRRARGFTPSPVFLPSSGPQVLGLGPELKCTLCLTKENQGFVSQHIGDMEHLSAHSFYLEVLDHLLDILQVRPEIAVHDLHPDYMTTRLAKSPEGPVARLREGGMRTATLQHHFAHLFSVMAENRVDEPMLALTLDGTGFGGDGTIWGGECLMADPASLAMKRLGRLAHLHLPGGEVAVREPWRIAHAALSNLDERLVRAAPWLPEKEGEARLVEQMRAKSINTLPTSSCGRLFDAASAILGLCLSITYEGQAAVRLESAQDLEETGIYPCPLVRGEDGLPILDTLALLETMAEDVIRGTPPALAARRFHLGLIRGLAEMAARAAEETGITKIGLSGGCLQNLTLAQELPGALKSKGLTPLVHRELPPGDGCISLGQAWYASLLLRNT